MLTFIIFVVILSILVFVHELGHYWTARRFGVKTEEFGFGLPPRIFGIVKNDQGKWEYVGAKTKKEYKRMILSLNWIPIGGFVKIKGEAGESAEDADSLLSKKIWKRVVVISAGVGMNIILAAVLISIGFGIGLPSTLDDLPPSAKVQDEQIQIFSILPDSPAMQAGVEEGDVIVSIDQQNFIELEPLQNYIIEREGQELNFVFMHQGEEMGKTIIPQMLEETGSAGIGVGLAHVGTVSYPIHIAVIRGVETTFLMTKAVIVAFAELLKNIIVKQEVAAGLSGPVGIAIITGKVARMGFIYVLQFTAFLSINLAVLNFLPFPALDGGRVLFLAIEKIRRKPVSVQIENLIHNIGFLILMALVVLVTYRDLMRMSDKIIDGIKNTLGF